MIGGGVLRECLLDPSVERVVAIGRGKTGQSQDQLQELVLPDLGFVRPMHGVTSRTRSYRVLYALTWPVLPALVALAPRYATTTERIGKAMLNVARRGFEKLVLENEDINRAAET